MTSRPWRNCNPGDIRTLPAGELWDGQTGVDTLPGGPFAVFASRVMGWRALARNLLSYQELHGLRTVTALVNRWAPPSDGNNTGSYVALVAAAMDVAPLELLDLRDLDMLIAACRAFSLAEGGARIPWDPMERRKGCLMALGLATLP